MQTDWNNGDPSSSQSPIADGLTTDGPTSTTATNENCDQNSLAGTGSQLAAAETSQSGQIDVPDDANERAIQQRGFRLQELVDSEQVYVKDLEQCCEYIKFMRETKDQEEPEIAMPEDLRDGKDRMIFGNIEAIYEWHRE